MALQRVVLSFRIPVAFIPLVVLASLRRVMGAHASGPRLTAGAGQVALIITAMNVVALLQQFAG